MKHANTSNDTLLRLGSAAAVLLVAAIAATVSFIHIDHLAVTHGQTPLAAALLPISIDGTVVASSLVLLRAARLTIAAPWLAQLMLWSAVGATLAANIAYGAAHGLTGALLSGWPAYAFIGCAEMAIGMVRRVTRPTAPGPETVTPAVTARPRKPTIREIQERQRMSPRTATKARREVDLFAKSISNGHGEH